MFQMDNSSAGSALSSFSDLTFFIYDGVDITTQIRFDVTGTLGTRQTIRSSQTANSIAIIPNTAGVTDTFAMLALAQVFTNKSIDATTNTLSNISNTEIKAAAGIVYSKLNLGGNIVNADISATAAIAFSKLATLSSTNILVGSAGNVATAVAVTGDISLSNTGVTAYAGTVPILKGGTGQTTKAAAFDALSPMTTGGDIIYGGASGTGTRLANGSSGQVLTSQGTTLAPIWSTVAAGAYGVQTKTANYTALSSDNVIYCSSAAFTVTLYSPVGNAGKFLYIQKTDAIFANIITVSGTGVSTTLNSLNENLLVISDGTNWIISARVIPEGEASYTPDAATNQSTGTLGATTLYRSRHGSYMRIRGSFTTGTIGGTELRLAIIASGETITSSANYATTEGIGRCYRSGVANDQTFALMEASKAYMTFGVQNAGAAATTKQIGSNVFGTGERVTIDVQIKISGWNE